MDTAVYSLSHLCSLYSGVQQCRHCCIPGSLWSTLNFNVRKVKVRVCKYILGMFTNKNSWLARLLPYKELCSRVFSLRIAVNCSVVFVTYSNTTLCQHYTVWAYMYVDPTGSKVDVLIWYVFALDSIEQLTSVTFWRLLISLHFEHREYLRDCEDRAYVCLSPRKPTGPCLQVSSFYCRGFAWRSDAKSSLHPLTQISTHVPSEVKSTVI